ncbi:MAG: PEP-CTERM sorting domain-containing protein [Puniceicoccaceae bacterium]
MNKVISFLICSTVFAVGANAQTIISSLDFESAGGYSTNQTEFSDGFGDYFTRTDGTNISAVGYTNSGNWFAAQDIDGDGSLPGILTWTIDVSGFTGLNFNFDVAEDDANDANNDWDNSDFVHVTYSIDSGSSQNLIWFENDGSEFNSAPLLDTDFDGTGDGTEVTETWSNFAAAISGTGSSLVISVEFQLNSGDEDLAIDNLEVTGTVVPEPGTIAFILGAIAFGFVVWRSRK